MDRKNFEKEAVKFGIYRVPRIDKEIVGKNAFYYKEEKTADLYGLYKSKEKKYVVFYKASERAVFTVLGEYDNENDAWDKLCEDIKK